MRRRERPINADTPEAPAPVEKPAPAAPSSLSTSQVQNDERTPAKALEADAPRRRRRKPRSRTPMLLALLVVVAIGFIVAAVLGGSGGGKDDSEPGAAPAPVIAPEQSGSEDQSGESADAEALGYPSFATNNTTRIGGPDAASNAAAIALAVFPSTTAAQRPAAVALVAEEDWAGAVAASVLMAEPLRAPLLIGAADGQPDATAAALEALDPQGSKETGGAGAFAIGDVAAPEATKTTTVAAGKAAAEAAAIAKLRDRLLHDPPKHLLIAPASDPQLAVPAAAWAARSGDPVLFAEGDTLPGPTRKTLERHHSLPVYVLGPSSAISSGVIREIAKIDKKVKRVSGEDPVANAIAFARFGDGDFGWNVNDPGHGFVLASADSPIEAATASALSGSGTWGPLLLTDSADKVPAELRSYLLDVKPGYTTNPTRAFYNHVWVIGDQEAIDVNQQAEVNELAELAKIGGGE